MLSVALLVFGVLLLLFGGGCTLILLLDALGVIHSQMVNGLDVLILWVPLGLLPLLSGWFLIRAGQRRGREERASSDQRMDRLDLRPPPGGEG